MHLYILNIDFAAFLSSQLLQLLFDVLSLWDYLALCILLYMFVAMCTFAMFWPVACCYWFQFPLLQFSFSIYQTSVFVVCLVDRIFIWKLSDYEILMRHLEKDMSYIFMLCELYKTVSLHICKFCNLQDLSVLETRIA